MLLNIYGSNSPYSIERVSLPCFRPHKVRVISIKGVLSEYARSGLYKITCDLIQSEPGNPHRILGFVVMNHKQLVLMFQPTQPLWYKLRYQEIISAEIKIQSVSTDELIIFDEFSLQLEVRESYGGIQ